MYSRSFFDLDGHGWQVMWMDSVAAEHFRVAFSSPDRAGTIADRGVSDPEDELEGIINRA